MNNDLEPQTLGLDNLTIEESKINSAPGNILPVFMITESKMLEAAAKITNPGGNVVYFFVFTCYILT